MSQLTKRENEVMKELLQGKSYKEVSNKLQISINTVKKHISNSYNKLNVKNAIEAYHKIKEYLT